VTPEAPQSRPAETRASSRHHVIDYDRETREWNERADAELARRAAIPSEVARLRAENATLRSGVELLSAENAALRSQVERLRLTPDEANAILEAAGDDASESGGMPLRAATLRGIAKRQGGGE
jgi:chromosome segregation ATPase